MKKINIILLLLNLAILGYFIFSFSGANGNIKALKQQNDSLLNNNKNLENLNAQIKLELEQDQNKIDSFAAEDIILKNKVQETTSKIKTLKSKYEKASSHADSFGSDELRRYFAEL